MNRFIFHPLLLPLFPILAFFNHNFSELSLGSLISPVIVIFVLIVVNWSLLDLFIRDKQKSALITSVVFFLLFSSGSFLNKTQTLGVSDSLLPSVLMQNRFILVFVILLLLLVPAHFIKKLKNNFRTLTLILNIISISLLVFPVLSIGYKQATRLTRNLGITRVTKFALVNRKQDTLPDIYYLIIDRHASSRTLKDYYGFDNSKFINFLQSRGFYVASQSAANYPGTHSSLPSSLNMKYHDELIKKMGKESFDKIPYYKLIEDNEVTAILKFAGYKYFHFGSMWDPTKINKYADFNYEYKGKSRDMVEASLKELEQNQNPLAKFLNNTLGGIVALELSKDKNYWRISIDQMIELSKAVKIPGPKFVFMHSLITHPPYVYDKDGYPLPKPLEGVGFQKEYIEQMKFANKMIEGLIDSILQGSEKPLVIVLQSDEGPYPEEYWRLLGAFNWYNASPDQAKEKMGILNAYYLSNVKTDVLYPSISPINSFRVIFNTYFGENLPLLPDRSYIHVTRDRPYNLFEVTDIIK